MKLEEIIVLAGLFVAFIFSLWFVLHLKHFEKVNKKSKR